MRAQLARAKVDCPILDVQQEFVAIKHVVGDREHRPREVHHRVDRLPRARSLGVTCTRRLFDLAQFIRDLIRDLARDIHGAIQRGASFTAFPTLAIENQPSSSGGVGEVFLEPRIHSGRVVDVLNAKLSQLLRQRVVCGINGGPVLFVMRRNAARPLLARR